MPTFFSSRIARAANAVDLLLNEIMPTVNGTDLVRIQAIGPLTKLLLRREGPSRATCALPAPRLPGYAPIRPSFRLMACKWLNFLMVEVKGIVDPDPLTPRNLTATPLQEEAPGGTPRPPASTAADDTPLSPGANRHG